MIFGNHIWCCWYVCEKTLNLKIQHKALVFLKNNRYTEISVFHFLTLNNARIQNDVQVTLWLSVTNPVNQSLSFSSYQEYSVVSLREGFQNDTSINFPSSHIVLDFLLHSSSSPLIKFLFYSSNMFFLRSCSSLWTKYFPFKIRWNINILWHKRDPLGHLTQIVCSGDKLWREINKALMKKEWRHQFWPQTVISCRNQWISRVLL